MKFTQRAGVRRFRRPFGPLAVVRASLLLLAMLAPLVARAESFDWRDYPGDANLPAGDYMTPVRDQGAAGTCWAFAAIGVVEAKYDIATKTVNSTLDLSEQNLVEAGSQTAASWGWFGDAVLGGDQDKALDYIRDHGVVNEATMPYTGTNSSPSLPIGTAYTLYRVSDVAHQIAADPASLKLALESDGPLTAAIDANSDWYTPSTLLGTSSQNGLQTIGSLVLPSKKGAANLDHAVVISGFTDDANAPGGGYWHIKNSWGATWNGDGNSDGYGFVSYAAMQADNDVSAIDGTAYADLVPAPEPSTLALGITAGLGLAAARWVRRRRGG